MTTELADEPRTTAAMFFSTGAEHASRLLALASLALAIAVHIVMRGDQQTKVTAIAAITFSGGFLLGTASTYAIAVVLACAYVGPLLARLSVDDGSAYLIFLIVGFLGVMLARWSPRWSLPVAWRGPLVGWALVVAVTWPIVAARELDFHPELASLLDRPVSITGSPAWVAVVVVADSAAVLIFTVLWLDWLFETFGADPRRFNRAVIAPLLASGAVACAFAAYQFFADVTLFNEGWLAFGRAGGTLLDANALGAVAMLCSCGCVALTDWRSRRWKVVSLAAIALTWVGIWASGSRTALIAELIAFAWIAWSVAYRALMTHGPQAVIAQRRTRIAAMAVACIVIAAALFAIRDTGPARRLGWIVPTASTRAVGGFMREMWHRFGYGTAAVEMIRKTPWFGVGAGMFAVMVADYPYSHLHGPLAPDNAQNWIRHQLAELGLVGSLGWITWAGVVAAWIVRRRPEVASTRSATAIAGALAGIVAVSQVGMPTQNAAVALTFWTLLFWYVLVRSPETARGSRSAAAPSWTWMLVTSLVVACAIGTWVVGTTTLQVPMRARNAGWLYHYGFSRVELTPAGEEFRWAEQYAVAVVPAPKRVVKLTMWVDRSDIVTSPARARVWHEDRIVIDTVLHDHRPVTTYVILDRDPPWFMVRTYFDRVVPPASREHGLAVQWTFVDAVPSETSDGRRSAAALGLFWRVWLLAARLS